MHAQGGLPIPNIVHIDQPDWWSEGGDMPPEDFGVERAEQLRQTIEHYGENRVAAFIAEPIQGAGGVIVPPSTYWPAIQAICDEHEILLIADEVICGFGRTGNWFGTETYDIRPDVMTVAKGLSSGYAPVGASIVSDRVAAVINSGGEFNHGYTYSGHPVTCAVALENLRIMQEEQMVENVREKTAPYLAARWQELADHPLVGEAKSVGMLGSIALTPDKSSRAAFASEAGTVGKICREHCFGSQMVMRHVYDRMVISPPLIISESEIDILMERVNQALDKTLATLRDENLLKAKV